MIDPTPEQVEAAARALWAGHGLNGEWDAGTHEAHELCREDARAALVAAASAAPDETSEHEAPDEERIVASVLAELEEHRASEDTGGWGTTFHRHGLSNEIHRGVDDCGRGAGKPVYVFDPEYLEEHDAWVVQATLRVVAGAAPQTENDEEIVDLEECPACDTPIDECSRDNVCCWDCNHAAGWSPAVPSPASSAQVGEAKLADMLMEHVFNALGQCTCGHATPDYGSGNRMRIHEYTHVAAVAAEWLRGGGR